MNPSSAPAPQDRRSGRLYDLLGILWVLGAAGAVMGPALAHGPYLGPFDWISRFGLSARAGVVVHNRQTFDQVSEFIPWTNLAWTLVHNGHLPLWNPYTVLGTPLAFNWQAATFSVPALIGYLFPMHLAYTVQVMATLVIAGTGVYVLGRVLGLGILGCTMAATVYELSGPFFGWLGWPISGVMSWAGWLFAATVVVLRGRHRLRGIACFAVVVACAVYAGQPDMLVILAVGEGVFVLALLAARSPLLGGAGPVRRPLFDIVVAAATGAALGAPLLLPGAQLISGSLRSGKRLSPALPVQDLSRLFFQGFDGLPVAGSRWFGDNYYTKTVAYVGVIAVVMAIVAVAGAIWQRRRRRVVAAFGAVAAVSAAIVYVPAVESVLDGLPLFGEVLWRRSTVPMTFALAVLAGIGTDLLARSARRHWAPRVAFFAFGGTALVLVAMWTFARGRLPAAEAAIRARSFIWPASCTALGLVAAGALMWRRHRRRGPPRGTGRPWSGTVAAALLTCETAFLVAAGAPLWSSSATYLTPTAAERQLAASVGSAVVGFGNNACFSQQLGIVPNVNVAYGVDEFADYEPLVPKAYAVSWQNITGEGTGARVFAGVPFSVFCPAVTSVDVARHYGIAFVLEPARTPGPPGAVFDRRIATEDLYRIPGAATATLVPSPPGGDPPGLGVTGTTIPVTRLGPASWKLVTHDPRAATLRLRLTAVPGMHATIDGRPLALHPFSEVMLQAQIPPGTHVVTVTYWPTAFSAGLAVAACALVGLVAAAVYRKRRTRRAVHRPRAAEA